MGDRIELATAKMLFKFKSAQRPTVSGSHTDLDADFGPESRGHARSRKRLDCF